MHTTYGGMTRNGHMISDMVYNGGDYVLVPDEKYITENEEGKTSLPKDLFARFATDAMDKNAPLYIVAFRKDEGIYRPLWAEPVPGEYSDYADGYTRYTELAHKTAEEFFQKLTGNSWLKAEDIELEIPVTIYSDLSGSVDERAKVQVKRELESEKSGDTVNSIITESGFAEKLKELFGNDMDKAEAFCKGHLTPFLRANHEKFIDSTETVGEPYKDEPWTTVTSQDAISHVKIPINAFLEELNICFNLQDQAEKLGGTFTEWADASHNGYRLDFPNGYSADIINVSHVDETNKYEVAVMQGKECVYDTPVTDEVVRFRDIYGVLDTTKKIAALEPRQQNIEPKNIKNIKYLSSEYVSSERTTYHEFTAEIEGRVQPLHYSVRYGDGEEEWIGIHTDENDIYQRMNAGQISDLAYILDSEARIGRYEKKISEAATPEALKDVLYEYMEDENFPRSMKERFDKAYGEKENALGMDIEEAEDAQLEEKYSPYYMARWLAEGGDLGASDVDFAETFVLMQKMKDNPGRREWQQLDEETMKNANTDDIANYIKDRLDRILKSDKNNEVDYNNASWWKAGYDWWEKKYDRSEATPEIDRAALREIYPYDAALWLTEGVKPELTVIEQGISDVDFAETLVLMYKMHNNFDNIENEKLTVEDMQNANTEAITNFVKNCLDEIIYSEEIDRSAWWKQNNEEDIEI